MMIINGRNYNTYMQNSIVIKNDKEKNDFILINIYLLKIYNLLK
jgi:hypothetical protein